MIIFGKAELGTITLITCVTLFRRRTSKNLALISIYSWKPPRRQSFSCYFFCFFTVSNAMTAMKYMFGIPSVFDTKQIRVRFCVPYTVLPLSVFHGIFRFAVIRCVAVLKKFSWYDIVNVVLGLFWGEVTGNIKCWRCSNMKVGFSGLFWYGSAYLRSSFTWVNFFN